MYLENNSKPLHRKLETFIRRQQNSATRLQTGDLFRVTIISSKNRFKSNR